MAAELYKPFIIRKRIERVVVKTVKSAKRIVDRRDNVIWEILENVMKGHPCLLYTSLCRCRRLCFQAAHAVCVWSSIDCTPTIEH